MTTGQIKEKLQYEGVKQMDATGRKVFWDALLNARLNDPQSIEALREATKLPKHLCRFRSVSENSLSQLQENKLFFSSADYYDDPFDTYFYIDLKEMKQFYEMFAPLLSAKDESALQFVDNAALLSGQDSKVLFESLNQNIPDFIKLRESLEAIRGNIQKQLFSICFCEEPLNETLWLKYADNHKGFVLLYDFELEDTYLCGKEAICKNCPTASQAPSIYPVYYSNDRYNASKYALAIRVFNEMGANQGQLSPDLQKMIMNGMAWEAERISLIKKKCHEYDQEWRMIRPQIMPARTYVKMKPCSVILGLRMPKYERKLVCSAAKIAGIKDIREAYIDENDNFSSRPIVED